MRFNHGATLAASLMALCLMMPFTAHASSMAATPDPRIDTVRSQTNKVFDLRNGASVTSGSAWILLGTSIGGAWQTPIFPLGRVKRVSESY